jgi:hypothetical protein
MSQIIPVTAPITAAQFILIDTHQSAIQVILDGAKISLTESQIKSSISVSTVRSAEIKDVNTDIVLAYPDAVPASIDTANFESNLAYIDSLKKREAIAATQAAQISTLVGVGENNAMMDVNLIFNNAKLVAASDKDLMDVVVALGIKYFSKAKAGKAVIYSIVASGKITIANVKPLKPFTNSDKTVLTILNVGGDISNLITVNPFEAVKLPKGWDNIVVTNLSGTSGGTFAVFMK